MANTTCPNCGKQLRPGARFCGNCGATLPAAPAGKSAAAAAQPPAAESLPCPSCGKPVRKGAKFCSQCGHMMNAETTAASATQTALPSEAPTLAGAPTRIGHRGEPPPAAGGHAPAPKPAAAMPPLTRRRSSLPLVLLAVLAVACLAAAGGGYFVANRQGWLPAALGGGREQGSETPTTGAVSVAVTETALLPASPTVEVLPTGAPSPEPTLPPTDVLAPTLEPTLVSTEPGLQLLSPTAGVTATAASFAPVITATISVTGTSSFLPPLIEDVFDGPLSANWLTWGNPRPTIDSGPGYKWLSLKADDPGAGGVTTRTGVEILNAPGLEIDFTAAIQDRYPNSSLFLDWDPQQTRRGPDLKDPGVFRVGLSKDTLTLLAPLPRATCEAAVDGLQQHRYIVRVTQGYHLELYLDDGVEPVCRLESMGLVATVPGRISFTGRGWVTHVKIVQPAAEP